MKKQRDFDMGKHLYSILLLFLITGVASAQVISRLDVSLFNNIPGLPHKQPAKVLTPPYHPGITIGTGGRLSSDTAAHQFVYSAKLGYFYHRLAQHGIQLYGNVGYQYNLTPEWTFTYSLGVGYLHSIPAIPQYELNAEGEYVRTSPWGRPQLMPTTSLSASYRMPAGYALFFRYQFWMQWPFVNQYVPLLPSVAAHLGVRIPLSPQKGKVR